MGMAWSYDRIVIAGLEKKVGAYTPDQQTEIRGWIEEVKPQVKHEEETKRVAEEAEQHETEQEHLGTQHPFKGYMLLWRGLSPEQICVRFMIVLLELGYAEMMKRTGLTREALRTANCRALKKIESKGLNAAPQRVVSKRRKKR